MKLATTLNRLERSDDIVEESFTIALTAKAIEVLSSQIYKDAHLAILRELGTNAADSHIESGKKNVPFEVTLPSYLAPELIIRDFGTGMAHQKVMTMYRTYFGSDKTNSNEVTGCLGLGSKSPFAYTDSFTVTSWFEGEKSIYTVFKNERGLPAISRIFNENSDEPSGVEVRIAVKKNDFHVFKTKAIQVYHWFNPRPIVNGISDSEWVEDEISYQSEKWQLRKDSYNRKLTIVMGNVAYHVERDDLLPIQAKLSDVEKIICDCSPILHVGIGDVDIAASRETLKFDGPKTFSSIRALLKNVAKEINEKFQSEIDSCKTFWEACCKLRKLKSTPPLGGIIPSSVKWKDIELFTSIKLKTYSDEKLVHRCNARSYFLKESKRSGYQSVGSSNTITIECDSDSKIFINDSKKAISRIGYLIRSTPKVSVAYVLESAELSSQEVKAVGIEASAVAVPKIYTLDEFLEEFRLKDIVKKISDLPDAPKNHASSRSQSYQILLPLKDSVESRSSHWQSYEEEFEEFDFESGGIYVEVIGNRCFAAGSLKGAAFLYEIESLVSEGPINSENTGTFIVGVRKRSVADFHSAPQWVLLDDYVKNKFEGNRSTIEAYELSKLHDVAMSYINMPNVRYFNDFHFDKNSSGIFKELCDRLKVLREAKYGELAKQFRLVKYFINYDEPNLEKDIQKIYDLYQLCEIQYPILPLIDFSSYITRKDEAIMEYIQMIDAKLVK